MPLFSRRRRLTTRQRSRIDNLILNTRQSTEAQSPGGFAGEIELAAPDEWAAVVNADDDGQSISGICNANEGTERERPMCRGYRVVVVALAVCGPAAVKRAGIPAGNAAPQHTIGSAMATRRNTLDALNLPAGIVTLGIGRRCEKQCQRTR